ncbi:MAG: type I polyketide synthase, partial [Candidatus Acidiferrum sp.]
MNSRQEPDQPERIAVVGMAGRFPDAVDPGCLWKNLCAGLESVKSFTDEQLISSGVDRNLLELRNYVKAGVVLEGIDLFDAEFFGITPREAELTDPQHRVFLECAWEALEDAGYRPDSERLIVGVFAGAGPNSYFMNNLVSHPKLMNSLNNLQMMIMIDKDYLATRVSYKLNLKGPAITIQCACSTSLVAVHLACQSLLLGECDMALAGGVSVRVPQIRGYPYQEGSILSPDGHCRAFDAAAQGTVIGSGAGIVVLKRLADALRDGDCIRGVIRGSAINNDGSDKIGYTAPSVDGQATVIATALALAGLNADEVSYVETHGTGTNLGDPIEIAALSKAFRRTTQRKQFCAIGSVKTNLGHLDAAAGVAGLIKVILALEHRTLPPSLNFKHANPEIDFSNSPFYVQQSVCEWKPSNARRIAGVSSFGIGGTNAHVIVEEAPAAPSPDLSRPWQLLTISAKSPRTLENATERLAQFLESHPGLDLADVAFTLQEGRKDFAHRRMLAAKTIEEASTLLRSRDQERLFTGSQVHSDTPVTFMFPGQGSQYVNMGLEIYTTEKTFRETVDSCSEILKAHLGFDLRTVVYPTPAKAAEANELLTETAVTQPAMFVLEYALAKLWMEWGLRPDAMIGHSIGEYVAACLAGVFSLEEGLALVTTRGRLMQSMPAGSMLAIRLDERSIQEYLTEDLSLAVINGPVACVVAGTVDAVEGLHKSLGEKQIPCRLLQTSHAFHSGMMQPILIPFLKVFENIKLSSPSIPYLSNLTGTWIEPSQATDPGYWARHLRETVRFSHGISELLRSPQRILLEVGPGKTLSTFARQHLESISKQMILSSLGDQKIRTSEMAEMMTTLGQLWIGGVQPDWLAFYRGQRRRRVPLPTYPFERQRYWIEERKPSAS